jgi:hypothetical protein
MANSIIEEVLRRQFLVGAGAVLTAPAVVGVPSLKPGLIAAERSDRNA